MPFKELQVYCSRCKFHRGVYNKCRAPQNIYVGQIGGTYFKPPKKKVMYNTQAHDKNAHNNCDWYKPSIGYRFLKFLKNVMKNE